jgi:hypothetical protein
LKSTTRFVVPFGAHVGGTATEVSGSVEGTGNVEAVVELVLVLDVVVDGDGAKRGAPAHRRAALALLLDDGLLLGAHRTLTGSFLARHGGQATGSWLGEGKQAGGSTWTRQLP